MHMTLPRVIDTPAGGEYPFRLIGALGSTRVWREIGSSCHPPPFLESS